ncbi:N-acetylmuramic acid 6-phosphate etherase [Blastopirellula sp. JC732]|uniref:N-acetylmuramic acid 6-phosphate etherase n=1 Tax=Blastopirellula sediminis TaxID=2894196 RepID=A0A9X1MJ80_9BACT|nr:N-acetylmuramic acid 6-phosphate etherase [Blastopirellula sediminis]MCC9609150.1 N-acetylmuramic acid 6-phosphate etherase [Blastopirellula sediminis]MCC9628073.1 N-acetylmuramic acid 6-phosphate etherase [Blastopirellula sediminis]
MLKHLTTEAINPASESLDDFTTYEIVQVINSQDAGVAEAVGKQAKPIAEAIDVIADRLAKSGRLIYFGAGTSGRLGVLDASECPPTFNSDPKQVVGLIAGGPIALTTSVEGAEDHPELAVQDLQSINLSAKDVVVGIATSGRTPYVVGGLDYAQQIGAFAIGLACNDNNELASRCNVAITPVVGPEILSGSTRMKAGTATKMVLNMLSTGAMIRLGKTFGNLMVDLRATNTKLNARAIRIVEAATDLGDAEADELLKSCGGEVKTAILVYHSGKKPEEARKLLKDADGHLKQALRTAGGEASPD